MLKIEIGREPAVPRDAATVVLLREGVTGFEVFLVRRHDKSGFMGGAHVFPGGKLDLADREERIIARAGGRTAEQAAEALGEDDLQRAIALHVAAVRETFEEAGVLIADLGASGDATALAGARARLEAGASFADVVESLDAQLRLDRIVPWTRWVTPEVEPRRFDARFFLARAPADQSAQHDARETTAAEWSTPAAALARASAGEISLPPPTLRSLELLAGFARIDEVFEDAAARRPPLVRPVFHEKDGVWMLVLPGDPEHPERDAVVAGPTRFVLAQGRWWSGSPRV